MEASIFIKQDRPVVIGQGCESQEPIFPEIAQFVIDECFGIAIGSK
jgi:hypothetical protein